MYCSIVGKLLQNVRTSRARGFNCLAKSIWIEYGFMEPIREYAYTINVHLELPKFSRVLDSVITAEDSSPTNTDLGCYQIDNTTDSTTTQHDVQVDANNYQVDTIPTKADANENDGVAVDANNYQIDNPQVTVPVAPQHSDYGNYAPAPISSNIVEASESESKPEQSQSSYSNYVPVNSYSTATTSDYGNYGLSAQGDYQTDFATPTAYGDGSESDSIADEPASSADAMSNYGSAPVSSNFGNYEPSRPHSPDKQLLPSPTKKHTSTLRESPASVELSDGSQEDDESSSGEDIVPLYNYNDDLEKAIEMAPIDDFESLTNVYHKFESVAMLIGKIIIEELNCPGTTDWKE